MVKKVLLLKMFVVVSIWATSAQDTPNIVLIFPDNIGAGEVGAYGGVRGVPTPNIDRIGVEGMRLTNFNVEYTCTPSRIAILTGRYATRAGENYFKGTSLWETTIAEGLKSVGYATGLFGKWDVGGPNWEGIREPTDQGFDEWYGIPGTSHVSQFSSMEGFDQGNQPIPYIWEGKMGQASKKVKPFNQETRRTIDREAAERGISFMQRSVEQGKPFFLYYPMTQLHFPTLPHPDKMGSTGAGDMGDSMADVDYNVGLILAELERLGIEKNTMVIWCSDNGAELRRPWRGNPGSWRGYYNSAMEGGVRTPFVIRWPQKIAAGQVTNELFHQVDLFTTIAAAVGHPEIVPNDRIMDGVDQLPFLEGQQKTSNRKSVIFLNGFGQVMAVKWHDWKLWYNFKTEIPDPNPDNLVRLFDLRVDPREEVDVKDFYPWVIGIMDKIVKEYEDSLKEYPRVPVSANIQEPYVPVPRGSGTAVVTYKRTDRGGLGERSPAMEHPDFSGAWSTEVLHTVSVINRVDEPKIPDLGSGWGNRISIEHTPEQLEIERVFFTPREIQQLIKYRYALNGSPTKNKQLMGRSDIVPTSITSWDGDRLVIQTTYPFQNPENGEWMEAMVSNTLWLEPATQTPWEPRLIVETKRYGVLGGLDVTSRTTYSKGYR